MLVREMKPRDAEQVSKITEEIMLDSWERHEKDYYPREALDFDISRQSASNLEEFLKVGTNFAYVADERGVVLGVASGRLFGKSGLATLGWIGIHPNHQRKGIGKALLKRVIRHCRDKRCHKLTLYTLPVLIPAINLYFGLGFVPEAYLHKEWWNVDFIKIVNGCDPKQEGRFFHKS